MYDVKQTTPLYQPVNTASFAYLFQLHNDLNPETQNFNSIIF
jgi:hypothetical protein